MDGVFMEDPPPDPNSSNKRVDGIRLKKAKDGKRYKPIVDGKHHDRLRKKRSVFFGQPLPVDGTTLKILVPNGEEQQASPSSPNLSHGSVSLCGRRRTMEDSVTVAPGLLCDTSEWFLDFFAVYDGHGGSSVSHVCRDRLHRVLAIEIEKALEESEGNEIDWNKVLEECFLKIDCEVDDKGIEDQNIKSVGSTAVVALIDIKNVIVANCGDSRAVLSRAGVAVPLSHDHKPDRQDELERIEAAGGRVINWNGYRVLGVLATSRSIGDQYLKPYVSSVPEVEITERTEKDEFIILASDGLWDVMSNEVACQVVRKCLNGRIGRSCSDSYKGTNAGEAAAVLAELAMARGSKDNISVVVIELNKST